MARTYAALPDAAARRLDGLPPALRSHVERVREIAAGLASMHGADERAVDLGAACHDLFRAHDGARLLALADERGIRVHDVERAVPMMLHGPVAAAWLSACAGVADADALDAVRWHTTGHPRLGIVGKIVYIADKLDPVKRRKYPFQDEVRAQASEDLDGALLTFVSRQAEGHLRGGRLVHPRTMDFRNGLLGCPSTGSGRTGVGCDRSELYG